MKISIPAALALVLAACGSYPENGQDPQGKLSLEVEKLRAETKQLNAMQTLACERIVDSYKSQADLTAKLDNQVRIMSAELKVLMDQVKTLQAQIVAIGPGPGPSPGPGPAPLPVEPGTRPKSADDIQSDIEAALAGLSSGKLKKEEAAAHLKPHPVYATPRVIEEIKRSPTRFEYVKQLEYVLTQLSTKELKVFLREALTQRGTRDSSARVVGLVRDSELGRLLEEHTATPDEDFRLLCGDSLVACRNAAGIPLLVQSLKSEQNATRTIAFSALKRVNRGETFGYSAPLAPEQNAAAIKSWEDWAQKFGPTLFD